MISKELLSEVFGVEVKGEIAVQKEYDEMNGFELEWDVICFNFSKYPIDYISHKCKKWADNNGYLLSSIINNGKAFSSVSHKTYPYKNICWSNITEYNTEPEAIFKVCQWILDNKEQK